MATRTLPSQKLLNQLLRYEPETGKLFWRSRPLEMFDPQYRGKIWNKRYADKEAFPYNATTGYCSGPLLGIHYPAHRVIWKMVTGAEPIEIDHIDGSGSNNRWVNLRNVDHAENGKNQKRHKNNSVGSGGIHKLPSGNYHVRIMNGGERISIGTYASLAEASAARRVAEREFGYHANHGR